jgi:hypothetical protein
VTLSGSWFLIDTSPFQFPKKCHFQNETYYACVHNADCILSLKLNASTRRHVVKMGSGWVTALAVGAFSVVCVVGADAATTGIKIASFSAPAPTKDRNKLNAVKGTATIKVNSETNPRYLVAYGSGTDPYNIRQCVELVKRYAAILGFKDFAGKVATGDNGSKLPTLGDGKDTAKGFAGKSNGGFTYVTNSAASLPKAGAVISIAGWTANPAGHVGIVIGYSAPSQTSTTVTFKIFEQNMPLDNWKEITFKKSNGKWSGYMPNKGSNYAVVGWANPTG